MLVAIAALLYFVAGILKLVGKHGDWLEWLLIIGGFIGWVGVLAYLRGWRDPLMRPRA